MPQVTLRTTVHHCALRALCVFWQVMAGVSADVPDRVAVHDVRHRAPGKLCGLVILTPPAHKHTHAHTCTHMHTHAHTCTNITLSTHGPGVCTIRVWDQIFVSGEQFLLATALGVAKQLEDGLVHPPLHVHENPSH